MIEEEGNYNVKILFGSSFDKIKDERIKEYRSKWHQNPMKHIVERVPVHLDIESTSICNLRCPFCATTHEKYSHGYISTELFSRVIDEACSKGVYSIKLNFRGEPLLHPKIAELVSYAKKQGIADVFFNTNATLLTMDIARRLIDTGLDRLIVSFEGYSKDVYEKNRVGARFENVVSNIRNFITLRRKLGSDWPVLRLQTVNIYGQELCLEKYKEFWQDYADEITCIDLRDETADHTKLSELTWECPYLYTRLCITWDGNVYTCPFMNHTIDKYKWRGFGNIKDSSIEEIWNSDYITKLREKHLEGLSHTVEPCKYCSYRATQVLKSFK